MKPARITYLGTSGGEVKTIIEPFAMEHSPGILGIYDSDNADANVKMLINMHSPLFVSVEWGDFP